VCVRRLGRSGGHRRRSRGSCAITGEIQRPDGRRVTGPQVAWKGRCHGPRKDRRWSRA
jgi:hypothetical protein